MHSDPLFQLAGVTVGKTYEDADQIILPVIVRSECCLSCYSPRIGEHDRKVLNKLIADTPLRGKHCYLRIERIRHVCHDCGAKQTAVLPGVNKTFAATERLVNYVAELAPKTPMSIIANHVGISADKVGRMVKSIIKKTRVRSLRTPKVLGIDDLRLRRRLFTVFTDGETGDAIGIISGGKSAEISEWIEDNLERGQVKVVVSDLAPANIAAVNLAWPKSQIDPGRTPAPVHVADKWHVIRAAHKALASVLHQTLHELRNGKGQAAGDAQTLERLRSYLLRGRLDALPCSPEEGEDARQLTFDFAVAEEIRDVRKAADDFMRRYDRVSRAFWAKMRLYRMYNAPTIAEARRHADSFIKQCENELIAGAFTAARKAFIKNQVLIFNFFQASEVDDHGRRRGVTNGPAERRNGRIRKAWRSACGMKMDLLWFRAVHDSVDMRKLLRTLDGGSN